MQVGGVCANENKVYDCHWIFKIISKIFFWLFSFETVWLGAILPICQLVVRKAPHVMRLFKVLSCRNGKPVVTNSMQVYATQPKLLA